jgi:protein phosphatase
MKFRSAAITDIGKLRQENEDRFLRDDQLGLFGVADGLGGIPGGAEAAECAVDALKRSLPELGDQADLVALTQAVSASVRELGQLIHPPHGIGSTLTFGVFTRGKLRLAHVGDSRAYLFKHGQLLRLTVDHSMENEIHKLKALREKIELTAANRKALTRCLGQPGVPEVDYLEQPVAPGEVYLFATDGISNHIDDPELAAILASPVGLAEQLKSMIELALHRGGLDNLTAVLVKIEEAK